VKQAFPGLRLRLPATSANLGPAFDAAGLALSLHLTVEAHPAPAFEIKATGRNADLCGARENNLLLDTYESVLAEQHRKLAPLHLSLHNEIPLGMGCGSSAAALLAGVALANHFGQLGWNDARIVAEASHREGHPDNIAACWYGGFTASAQTETGVAAVTFAGDPYWEMLLALPGTGLATRTARALLPGQYAKADAVFNVQRVALLPAAFAQGRLDLLRIATEDRIHQPYRAQACPLLPLLLPLRDEPEMAAVTLSGAGPSVLLFLAGGVTTLQAEARLAALLPEDVEVLPVRIAPGASTEVLDAS
jgi:homoserine kinase